MFRSARRVLLCQWAPQLKVLEGQNTSVVPNHMTVVLETCELHGLGSTPPIPLLHMRTRGMSDGRELVVVRERDLLRPRDHSMVLSLLETVWNMVKNGQTLDEGVEIPLETGRKSTQRESPRTVGVEGFDHLENAVGANLPDTEDDIHLWLTFYAHPLRALGSAGAAADREHVHALFLPREWHDVAKAFSTPLRMTNLLFKHHCWATLPPALYFPQTHAAIMPSDADIAKSRLSTSPALPLPGVSATLHDGTVHVVIPDTRTARTTLDMLPDDLDELTLLASRHAPQIEAFICWDPRRPLDSFVVSTSPDAPNWNDPTAARSDDAAKPDAAAAEPDMRGSLRVGVTYVHLTLADDAVDAAPEMEEDGLKLTVSRATLAALARCEDVEAPGLKVTFAKDVRVAEPEEADEAEDLRATEEALNAIEELPDDAEDADAEMPNWLSFIKGSVGDATPEPKAPPAAAAKPPPVEDERKKNLSRRVPELTHLKTEYRPMSDTSTADTAIRPQGGGGGGCASKAPPPPGGRYKTAVKSTAAAADPAPVEEEAQAPPAAEPAPAAPTGGGCGGGCGGGARQAPPAGEGAEGATAEAPEDDRTTVEPRMTKADFGGFESDKRAQDEKWEPYVIRVATVLSAVFAHCGRRIRPVKGKDEPGSVKIDLIPTGDGGVVVEASVNKDVCSLELIPEGIDVLNDRLNKHCRNPPHPMALTLWFSV